MTDTKEKPRPLQRLADFVYEALFLKHTPRSGYKFLGRGEESVAEHSFGVVLISYTLAKMSGLPSQEKILKLALFHDLAEARTGDLNYMNKQYVSSLEEKATRDLSEELPFEEELMDLFFEWKEGKTLESQLAHDADQIDMLTALLRHKADGSRAAEDWIHYALKRLKTEAGKELAESILNTHPDNWWFEKKDSLWVNPKDPKDTK
ncbi:MAG: HD domain-containing protein [Deltaproteobacteria bacterium]|jgi:putative hydrolase of HD superfamily|nr:HD domain-containing protein [Deltaproteobacteria bacterium]